MEARKPLGLATKNQFTQAARIELEMSEQLPPPGLKELGVYIVLTLNPLIKLCGGNFEGDYWCRSSFYQWNTGQTMLIYISIVKAKPLPRKHPMRLCPFIAFVVPFMAFCWYPSQLGSS